MFTGVERIPVADGREVLVGPVPQGQSRPCSHRGVACKRVGNVNARRAHDEYNRMLLESLHAERRWENEPAEGWAVADLDGAEIARTMDEAVRRGRAEDPATRDPAELLRGLGPLREGRLLRAAVVLFGREDPLYPLLALRDVRQQMEGQATEWEVRGDLQFLRQLGLVESLGRGRGAFWRLV